MDCEAGIRPSLQGGGLDAHVGEQVHGRLLHVEVGGAPIRRVVVTVQSPRPLDRARAEHQRAARGPVQRQVVGRRPAPYVEP